MVVSRLANGARLPKVRMGLLLDDREERTGHLAGGFTAFCKSPGTQPEDVGILLVNVFPVRLPQVVGTYFQAVE